MYRTLVFVLILTLSFGIFGEPKNHFSDSTSNQHSIDSVKTPKSKKPIVITSCILGGIITFIVLYFVIDKANKKYRGEQTKIDYGQM
jgi:hypothetical protein